MNETWWVNHAQLDSQQREVLLARPEEEFLLIGPPGSGKTNILLLRGNYVKSIGPRVVFMTFTRPLCEFLRSSPNLGRGDQMQRGDVTTFMSWGRRLLRENEWDIPDEAGEFESQRDALIKALAEMTKIRRTGKLYDTILVDEVQDFRADELQVMRQLSHRISAAGDARQRIWSHREGISTAQAMVMRTIRLEGHYRVGRRICELADQILPPFAGEPHLIDNCNYSETARPSSVNRISCNSLNNEFGLCIERIRSQRRYIGDEPIGVLSFRKELRDGFWDRLMLEADLATIAVRQSADEYVAFNESSLIRVMTAHAAKGAEFRAVHLLGAEEFRSNRRELAFTAVTRAKSELDLYHVSPMPGHMMLPTNILPDISNLF